MNLRIRASEARRQAGRLEQLARAAREQEGSEHRDRRAEEQALVVKAAACEERARQMERAAGH
jgi:hypothetical protein